MSGRLCSAMPDRRPPGLNATLHIPVTTALKTQLELEAWECQLSLKQYVAGLLKRRGKWARTVSCAGGYDIQSMMPLGIRDRT
jgi:hypothetical protein